MSAMTATIQEDRIIMLTDAAFYKPDGTLTRLASKTLQIPIIPAAFSSRGADVAFHVFALAALSHRMETWDDFVAASDDVLADFESMFRAIAPKESCQLMMAGWSADHDRGEVLFRTLHPQYGLAAGTTYFWCGPCHATFGIDGAMMGDPVRFDARRHGIAAFEDARMTSVDLTCGQATEPVMGHSIGGWIDATEISAAGVATSRLHTWPDEIGHKIKPAAPVLRLVV
jgi:hypothetical protein